MSDRGEYKVEVRQRRNGFWTYRVTWGDPRFFEESTQDFVSPEAAALEGEIVRERLQRRHRSLRAQD